MKDECQTSGQHMWWKFLLHNVHCHWHAKASGKLGQLSLSTEGTITKHFTIFEEPTGVLLNIQGSL